MKHRLILLPCLAPLLLLAPVPTALGAPPAVAMRGDGKAQQKLLPETTGLLIPMDPLIFSFVQQAQVLGRIEISLVLSLSPATGSAAVQRRLPQIRSDFLSALSSLASARFRIDQPIDPDLVATYLRPLLRQRLSDPQADIYVQQATINPT